MEPSVDPASYDQLCHAYERVKVDLAALRPEDLLQVNADIPAAVSKILRALPQVKELRARIAMELPMFDLGAFDKLEDIALALSFAHGCYQAAIQPPGDLKALSAEATQLRERLLADARALSLRGLIDGGPLAKLKGAKGYQNTADDLLMLSNVLEEAWPQVQGKLATTPGDLLRAHQLSTSLTKVVQLREQGPALLAAATEQRKRASTLVVRVYEDARRAVAYLRAREGDAEAIAPSLYQGRPRRRRSEPSDTP